MRKFIALLLTLTVFEAATYAQSPQLLNYQGVARNGFGNALPNRQMTLRLSIRNGSSTGTVVYTETRSVTTNGGGLYSVQIGSTGTSAMVGSIANINWQVGSKFLQVEVDPDAGTNFIDLGTMQLVSVPYALSANTASPVGAAGGDLAGTYPNPTVANGAINTIKLADAAVTTLKLADQSVTATKLADYSVTTAKLADGSVTTVKLADASVTDAKIVTVAGSKVTGNITGNAANVTGTVAVANGGTGATTAAGARTNLGLGNVDNTSDFNKPISTATQTALDLKENVSNKSTATTLGTSDALYPTQNAVKTYVDAQVASGTVPDATTLVKGKVQLAGDLTGTAALPEVAASAITTTKIADAAVTTAKITDANVTTAKLADASVTDAKIVTVAGSKVTGNITGNAANVTGTVAVANGGTGATTAAGARTNLGLGNVDNTSDLNKPISTATQAALDLKENLSNKSTATALGTSDALYPTQNAVKTYVDGQITSNATPDATTLVKGKVQLAGDLTGTAALPEVAAGAITTAKLADASVTDAKIVTVAGSKVTGNITGNAANVTGTVVVANGGTGATTAAGARTNLGLGNVDNTSDLNKPISTATQAALDLKENLSNKSTATALGTSDALYPTQNAVKTYVDAQVASGTVQDATTLVKGKVQLAGDLTGTAALPEVAASAITTAKLADASVTDAKIVTVAGSKVTGNITGNAVNVTGTVAVANGGTGATTAAGARTNLVLGNVDNTSDLNKPISTATQAALDLKENLSNKSTATTLGTSDALYPTQNAVKTYVDAQVASGTVPDATTLVKGKVQLAGDLTGTAALPEVAASAITTAKLADGSVTTVKLADASVTDAKIVTVAGSKVTGNITGNAANVTGTVAVANGGTGLTNIISGQIPFGNGTSAIGTSSNLTWDNSTGSLGIGTSTPGNGFNTALDVVGSASFRTNTSDIGLKFDGYSPSGTLQVSRIYTDATSGTPGDFILGTYPNGHLNQLYLKQSNGFVGIQTTSPTTALDVNGTVKATSLVKVGGTSSQFLMADGTATSSPSLSGATGLPLSTGITGILPILNGGTAATTAAGARTNLGATTVGDNFFTLSNPSAVTFPRMNADNSVSALTASDFRTAIGAGTSSTSGTVTSIGLSAGTTGSDVNISGSPITSSGTITINIPDASSSARGVVTTGTQTFAGSKTFSSDLTVNGITVGKGLNSVTNNTAIGTSALVANTTGSYNTANGYQSLYSNTTGVTNTANGYQSLYSNTTGEDNTAIGVNAIRTGSSATNGSRNTAVGRGALENGNAANNNTAIGAYTINSSTTGHSNVAMGTYALQSTTSASYNVGVGFETLKNTTTGGNNTAIGHGAMQSNTSGDVNTAVGENALVSNTSGRYNTSIGVQSQEQNTTGSQNTAIGVAAIDRNTSGHYNAVLGAFAGRYIADNSTYNTSIDNSVLVGALARPLTNNANNEIVIGYNAIGNGSNTAQIGNSSITNVKTSGSLTAGAITYPNTAGTNGYYLKTDGSGTASWAAVTSGTVTSLGLSTGTTGTDVNVSGSPITSSGTITLNIPDASATARGLVTTGSQIFSGNKDFRSPLRINWNGAGETGTGGALQITGDNSTYKPWVSIVNSGNSAFNLGADEDAAIIGFDDNAQNLDFRSGITWNSFPSSGTLRMRITSAGNVGIGTTSPQARLDVAAATRTDNPSSSDLSFYVSGDMSTGQTGTSAKNIEFRHSNATQGIGFGYNTIYQTGSNTNQELNILSRGSSPITLNAHAYSTGNVGIGTSSPINKLDVVGNIGVNTSGQTRIFSTYYGAGSDGSNIFIGGGGLSSTGSSPNSHYGSYNTSLGVNALYYNTTGYTNTSMGISSLAYNTTGYQNTAVGGWSLFSNTEGYHNTSMGQSTMYYNTTGYQNTALGKTALHVNTTGYQNTAVGNDAGFYTNAGGNNQTSNTSVYIGYDTRASASGNANEIVIGASARGNGSNTVQIGNSSITNLKTSGTLTAGAVTYPNTDGTANQVLITNGSGVASWSTPTTAVTTVGTIAGSSTANGATISGATLTLAPADGTNGGIVTNGTQTFAGSKTFSSDLTLNGKVIVGALSAASASAVLEASSTTQGFLPPRMSSSQRDAISSPVAGLMIWCNNCGTNGEVQVYNGTSWTNMIGGRRSLVIGESYGGGIVAYILQVGDPGYDENVQHGIIAATVDQSSSIRWNNGSNITTGASGTALGTGLSNTNTVITSQGATSTSYATGLARAYTGGGYNDWYLPSKDELNKLFLNKSSVGNFIDDYYWSSSEFSGSTWNGAWFQRFSDGYQQDGWKDYTFRIRAIRSF